MSAGDENRRRFLGWCLKALGIAGSGGIIYSAVNFLSRGDLSMKAVGANTGDWEAGLAGRGTHKGGEPSAVQAEDGTVEIKSDSIPSGTSIVVSAGFTPVIVVHASNGFKAFDAKCAHLGCLVKWDSESNQFICPCHGGHYNSEGQVIAGPPPLPLKKCKITETGDKIKISVI